MGLEQSQSSPNTRFCVISELDLTKAEVEAVLEEGRRLGLRVWSGPACGDPVTAVALTVRQSRRATDGDEAWWIPFEIRVPIDLQWGGYAIVRHERGGWSLTRIEYDH